MSAIPTSSVPTQGQRFRLLGRRMKRKLSQIPQIIKNSLSPTIGVNLGGGDWYKTGWANFDSRHEGTLLDHSSKLPFQSDSIQSVFSSHFFEHLDDATAQNLFDESYRILRNEGHFRIVVPDFDLALRSYRQGNHDFFDFGSWGMKPRHENWIQHSIEPSLENKVSYAFLSYSNMPDYGLFPPWHYLKNYYCGPAKIPISEIKAHASAQNIHEFNRWIMHYKPSAYFHLGHINVYDLEKLSQMLEKSGFEHVYLSSYQGSRDPQLRSVEFDTRPDISLFVEAKKINSDH